MELNQSTVSVAIVGCEMAAAGITVLHLTIPLLDHVHAWTVACGALGAATGAGSVAIGTIVTALAGPLAPYTNPRP